MPRRRRHPRPREVLDGQGSAPGGPGEAASARVGGLAPRACLLGALLLLAVRRRWRKWRRFVLLLLLTVPLTVPLLLRVVLLLMALSSSWVV